MTVLELLSSQLDRQVTDAEKSATQNLFSQQIEFWNLCLMARELKSELEVPEVNRQPKKQAEKC